MTTSSLDRGPVRDGGRVLVTGAAGMLGSQLLLDAPSGFDVVGTDLVETPRWPDVGVPREFAPAVDLTRAAHVAALLDGRGPFDAVIHAAAFTNVDAAEEQEELAAAVNATAPHVLASACAERGISMLLVGTDFVFDGTSEAPYREEDEPRPLGAYGRTKLRGEELALDALGELLCVVRTQWLYGPRGKSFPATMLRLAEERDAWKVVDDQTGAPTSTLELAPALWDCVRLGARGTYHAACEGSCTWYELAVATLELAGVHGKRIEPCSTAEYPTPARRPAYSVLDSSKLAGLRGRSLASWHDALADFTRTLARVQP